MTVLINELATATIIGCYAFKPSASYMLVLGAVMIKLWCILSMQLKED